MRIVDERFNLRCDVGCCKNTADYIIEVDDNKRHDVHICKHCLDELHSLVCEMKKPASVENVVRRAENRRNEWKNKR